MARISVIIPMHQTRAFVGACIESLRQQTFEDFEVIAIDDGSTDGTCEVAREAAAGDERFRFVRQDNAGPSAARNRGIDMAAGTFVTFLDSDDCYEPQTLELLDFAQRASGADLVDFLAESFYESEEARSVRQEQFSFRGPVPGVLSGPDLFTLYIETNQYATSPCFHLIRKSLLVRANLRFAEGLLYEDELFVPMLYAYAHRALLVPEYLYRRRIRLGSAMTAPKDARHVGSLFRITQALQEWIQQNGRDYDCRYVDAFAHLICILKDAAFRYGQQVPPAQLQAYVDGLDFRDRLEFDLGCRYGSQPADERFLELKDSLSYRLGRAATVLPRKVLEFQAGLGSVKRK